MNNRGKDQSAHANMTAVKVLLPELSRIPIPHPIPSSSRLVEKLQSRPAFCRLVSSLGRLLLKTKRSIHHKKLTDDDDGVVSLLAKKLAREEIPFLYFKSTSYYVVCGKNHISIFLHSQKHSSRLPLYCKIDQSG